MCFYVFFYVCFLCVFFNLCFLCVFFMYFFNLCFYVCLYVHFWSCVSVLPGCQKFYKIYNRKPWFNVYPDFSLILSSHITCIKSRFYCIIKIGFSLYSTYHYISYQECYIKQNMVLNRLIQSHRKGNSLS